MTSETVRRTLEQCHWNKTLAASQMGFSRRHLYRVIEKYRMDDLIRRRC
ncbi:helix-turn-helix domain-containing protein [Acidobacteriota bacterium]